MNRTILLFMVLICCAAQAGERRMLWGDTSRLGRPFAKDPSVIRFGGRYLLYYSMPAFPDQRPNNGWSVGIAESRNLIDWTKVGEVNEGKGIAAPFAKVIEGKVHLFYQSYGGGPKDAICHAVSNDGLKFEPDPSNPVFRSTGAWNSGRAIDAEVARFHNRWFLFAATRDPASQIQMIVAAVSDKGFDRAAWKMFDAGPILKPELPWEQKCIEAPAAVQHGDTLFLFYGGAYNNMPQQIGCARSQDGLHWTRLSDQPFLPVGKPGSWNSSESGHPGTFVDEDGQVYLFYQGNNDHGKTWFISFERIGWRDGLPFIEPSAASPDR